MPIRNKTGPDSTTTSRIQDKIVFVFSAVITRNLLSYVYLDSRVDFWGMDMSFSKAHINDQKTQASRILLPHEKCDAYLG